MPKKTILSFSLILFLLATLSHLLMGQSIDRTLISSAYHSDALRGEWSVGETFIGYHIGTDLQLTNGFLQGFLASGTSILEEANRKIVVFPNPFRHRINIVHNFTQPISFEVRDLNGRMLTFPTVASSQTTSDLSQLPSGCYSIRFLLPGNTSRSMLIFKM